MVVSRSMGIYILVALLFLAGLVLELLRVPNTVQAAESSNSIELYHRVPDIKNLPAPATMMPIAVEVRNTKKTDLKIRLVASRDGKMIDLAMPQGVLNVQDVPVYQVELPAPLAYMTYQFVAQTEDGTLVTTRRFILRRNCIQKFQVNVPDTVGDAEFRKNIADLVGKARSLERDTANYETALKLIDGLKVLTGE